MARRDSIKYIYENFHLFNPDKLSDQTIAGLMAYHAMKKLDVDGELKLISKDPFYFATNGIWTKNEHSGRTERFPDYPYLRDYLFPGMMSQGNYLWEKSRRMMLSISFCVYFFWEWLTPGLFLGGITSRSQMKVDDGGGHSSWDSLFGKIRFMYDRMAEEKPHIIEHFLGGVPRSDLLFRRMVLENPRTGSAIIGEAPTPNCLTGGGFTKIFVDEAARVPNMSSIHANLIMAARNCHYVSYPNGQANTFYKIRSSKGHFGFGVKRIIWSMYPGRDREWYEDESKKMTRTQRGMLLDIDYSESAEAKVFYEFAEGNKVFNLQIDPNNIVLWWDFGSSDATAVVFANVVIDVVRRRKMKTYRLKTVVQDWNTDYMKVVKAVREELKRIGFRGSTRRIRCVGGYDVKATQVATGIKIGDYYAKEGFNIEATPYHEIKATLDEINVVMRDGKFLVDSECTTLTDAIEGWEWPTNKDGTRKPGVTNPAHTEYSHIGKAVEYGMAWELSNETEPAIVSIAPTPTTLGRRKVVVGRQAPGQIRRGVLVKR